jgi:hypothetical protein
MSRLRQTIGAWVSALTPSKLAMLFRLAAIGLIALALLYESIRQPRFGQLAMDVAFFGGCVWVLLGIAAFISPLAPAEPNEIQSRGPDIPFILASLPGRCPALLAAGVLVTCRLTPRCSGQHPGIRPGVAAELIRR